MISCKCLFCFFILYSIYSLVNTYSALAEKSQVLAEKRATEQEWMLRNQELEKLMEDGNHAALLERAARTKLSYAYPDEQVFTDMAGN